MMIPPDESYSTAGAAVELGTSERQALRYLKSGKLEGSQASGHWRTTALAIWKFRGIADDMMSSWREYCATFEEKQKAQEEHNVTELGE